MNTVLILLFASQVIFVAWFGYQAHKSWKLQKKLVQDWEIIRIRIQILKGMK